MIETFQIDLFLKTPIFFVIEMIKILSSQNVPFLTCPQLQTSDLLLSSEGVITVNMILNHLEGIMWRQRRVER